MPGDGQGFLLALLAVASQMVSSTGNDVAQAGGKVFADLRSKLGFVLGGLGGQEIEACRGVEGQCP